MMLVVIDHDPEYVKCILAVTKERKEVLSMLGCVECDITKGHTSSIANVSSLSITLTFTVLAKSSIALSSISKMF